MKGYNFLHDKRLIPYPYYLYMKTLILTFLIAGTLFSGCTKQAIVDPEKEHLDASQAKRTRTVQRAYYNEVFTIPCANNNQGEQVSLIGTSELITETLKLGAITTVTMTFQIKNAKGKGSETNANYTGGGGFTSTIISSSRDLRYSFTYDEKIAIRAPGKNNNYVYKLSASQLTGARGNVIKEYKVKESTDCN
jgi:hypothetical protein